jgi:rod shape-determining protein MreD
MRRIVALWVVAFLVALAAQGTVVPLVSIGGNTPDLVFVVLFAFALKFGITASIWVGFAVGLCQDLYSPAILGQNALSKSVAGMFLGLFDERVMRTDPLTKMVLLLVAFLIHDAAFGLTDMLKLGTPLSRELLELGINTLPRALYTIVFGALYYGWDYLRRPAQFS